MSDQGSSGRPSRGARGARTAAKGTPAAVDSLRDPHARSKIALFVAGPVIWSAHFMVVYLVSEAGCNGGGPGLARFAPPVPAVVTLVTTAVAVLACLLCARWGWRMWRADQREQPEGPGSEPLDPGGALAFGAFLLSLLGVVEVLFVGLPAAFLPC